MPFLILAVGALIGGVVALFLPETAGKVSLELDGAKNIRRDFNARRKLQLWHNKKVS